MIAVQAWIGFALLAVVFIYGVLALTDIDDPQDALGYQPLNGRDMEAPGDE